MAYRIEPGRSVADEIRRVVREEAQAAAEQLRNVRGPNGSEAIHEARKSVKKIRAVLRLVRKELGSKIYRQENARFGNIGRTLSELRDAGAMLETFKGMQNRYRDEVKQSAWETLLRLLNKRMQQAERSVDERQLLEIYPQELEKIALESVEWPLDRGDFAVIAPGLKRAFQRGRAAMAAARQNSSPENFHEWRKRVKDHWYHVRLLERIWSPMMTAYAGVLKDLQAWLGDDHNLTVLREMIEDSQSKRTHARDLLRLIEQHQAGLREQALAVGKRIYAPKPKQLVSAMESLWNVSPEPETILEAL